MWPWSSTEPAVEAAPEPEPEPETPSWLQLAARATEAHTRDPAAAADVIRSSLQQAGRGDQARLHCALGFALGAGGDYQAAAAELRLGLAHAQVALHARYGLGVCELCRGKPSTALDELQSCVDARPDDGQALLALGLALLQSGRAGEAVPRLEAAVKAERDFERAKEAVAVLAEALRSAGKVNEARTRYGHVIEMGGRGERVASGHRGLGLAALQERGAGHLGTAAAHFAHAVAVTTNSESGPTQALAHRLHGVVLRRQGLYEQSADALRSALRCDETNAGAAAAQLGLALSLWRGGDLDAAERICTAIHDSTAPSHFKSRADTLAAGLAASRLDVVRALRLALGVLEQLHHEQPSPSKPNVDEAPLHAVVGWAQRQAGSVRDSVAHYEAAIRCMRTSSSKELGQDSFGAPPEAILDFLLGQAVLARRLEAGRDPPTNEEEEEGACDRIERALIITEGSLGTEREGTRARAIAVACCRELGLHAGGRGAYAEAVEQLEHACTLNPADAETQFQLATALGYVDREKESDAHYATALELRSGTLAPEPHEQGRLLAIELVQEVEEARSFFHEVTCARRAALAELPTIQWVFWSRNGLFD